VAASGTSLGGAWVQVTADASGVAASLRDDVTDATKQIAKVFDQAFAGIEADAEQAAGAVGDSLGEAGDMGSATRWSGSASPWAWPWMTRTSNRSPRVC
jgi:hypothetical protein